jgi:hypothetical protein
MIVAMRQPGTSILESQVGDSLLPREHCRLFPEQSRTYQQGGEQKKREVKNARVSKSGVLVPQKITAGVNETIFGRREL